MSLTFSVPASVRDGTLTFGGNEVPIDLRGQTGTTPTWDYRAHYAALTGNKELYSVNGHSISLVAIETESSTGDLILRFIAANDNENTDFHPQVTATAARVSLSGSVFDGVGEPSMGWKPPEVIGRGPSLAPGGFGEFALRVPRVSGGKFQTLPLSSERPDAALLRLTAEHRPPGASASVLMPDSKILEGVYATYERNRSEEWLWFPDLTISEITMTPATPTVGDMMTIAFTLSNRGPRPAQESTIRLRADGVEVEVEVERKIAPSVPKFGSQVVAFSWKVTAEPVLFEATADVDDAINESREDNNVVRVDFAGGHLPDLVIESVTYTPTKPWFGQLLTVTVTVANRGSGRAGASRTVVSLGAAGSRFISFPGMVPGETISSIFEVRAKGPTEAIKVEADAYGEVVEADETNNATLLGFESVILSDYLILPSLRTSNPDGDGYGLSLDVQNVGFGTAPASVMQVDIDGSITYGGGAPIPELAPGEITTVTFTGSAPSGIHIVLVVADGLFAVPETNETNNEFTYAFRN
jgi:hypothetical protein